MVICCHGLFSWKGDENSKFAQLAQRLGPSEISVFRFDCTGCGESEGDFQQATLRQRIQDLEESINFLFANKILTDQKPLFLVGSSFGGPVILSYTAHHTDRVQGLITWSAPVDLLDFYQDRFPLFFKKWKQGKSVVIESDDRLFTMSPAFLEALQEISPLELLVRLSSVPLLVIHGTDDETVPISQANILLNNYPGPKQQSIIPGASHRLIEQFSEVNRVTCEWILTQLENLSHAC